MARVSELVKDVRPSVPEAIVPEIEDAIRRTLIHFCRSSRIWRETLEIDLEPGLRSYRLRPSQNGRVDQVLTAVYSDAKRDAIPMTVLEHDTIALRSGAAQADVPKHFSLAPDARTILFYPTPAAPVADAPVAKLYVVAVPQRSSSTFPDFIREEWYEGIVHGALEMLMRMKNKPWTDLQMAATHRLDFHKIINQARREAVTKQWARNRVRPRLTF